MIFGDTASLVYEDSSMKTIRYAWVGTIIEILLIIQHLTAKLVGLGEL